MGRIFISAGHFNRDSGAISILGTKEADEMMRTRDLLAAELQSRGLIQNQDFFLVPDNIDLGPTIRWINARSQPGDIAVEIHGDSASPSAQGATAFHIAGNSQRQADAQKLVNSLVVAVTGLRNRGAKPDTTTRFGRLGFCRDVDIPSVLIELCFLSNRNDMALLTGSRNLFAKGLADGLLAWSGATPAPVPAPVLAPAPAPVPTPFPVIDIQINGVLYDDKGILVNGNSFIPVDLVDRLGLDSADLATVRRVSQGGVVYLKAIELQGFNVTVEWQNTPPTVILRTNLFPPGTATENIMSSGTASESQLRNFILSQNSDALDLFPDLPSLYIEEAAREGVNHDIAFSQMCLETGYLAFGGDVEPTQNNFCGLGTTGGGVKGAFFPDARTGVKAHIQHLKAYASTAPAMPPIVDPRFDLVSRGIAPLVGNLSGRWATDSQYGTKIMNIQRQLLATT
jgi:hypothetical protein